MYIHSVKNCGPSLKTSSGPWKWSWMNCPVILFLPKQLLLIPLINFTEITSHLLTHLSTPTEFVTTKNLEPRLKFRPTDCGKMLPPHISHHAIIRNTVTRNRNVTTTSYARCCDAAVERILNTKHCKLKNKIVPVTAIPPAWSSCLPNVPPFVACFDAQEFSAMQINV